jgi:uncharacterized protein YndB with AHSA1/START domain
MSASGDRATVTVAVAVDPHAAFEVFTQEIDLWWRRGPAYRRMRRGGIVCIEPGVGGRVFESADGRVFEMGRVLVWAPPSRLVIEWRGQNFADEEKTRVDVRFEATETGTRVTLEHSGWAAIRPDHPARHGIVGAPFASRIGSWWGALMTTFRLHVESKESAG